MTRRSLREALSAELRFAGPAFGLLFLAGFLPCFALGLRTALKLGVGVPGDVEHLAERENAA